VDRFCFGIARNIYKEKSRLLRRENSALHKFIEDLGNSSAEQIERIYSLLQPCFEQLALDDQQLLLAYCHEIQGRSRIECRHQLAEKMKITVMTLRARVSRLRNKLTNCVQKRANLM
jgi:DNA-directed RNA polymerase specialized sigma24 family protein